MQIEEIMAKNHKFAIAQINTKSGDIEFNAKKIIEKIKEVQENNIEVVVFPELALVGVGLDDAVKRFPIIVEQNLIWLKEIAKMTTNTTAIIGFYDKDCQNSVAIISCGEIKQIINKSKPQIVEILGLNFYITIGEVFANNIGLYIYGDNSSGKTHLTACMCNELVWKGYRCVYTNFATILNELLGKNPGDSVLLSRLQYFDFVFIDDLGKEFIGREYNPSSVKWAEGKLFEILNDLMRVGLRCFGKFLCAQHMLTVLFRIKSIKIRYCLTLTMNVERYNINIIFLAVLLRSIRTGI